MDNLANKQMSGRKSTSPLPAVSQRVSASPGGAAGTRPNKPKPAQDNTARKDQGRKSSKARHTRQHANRAGVVNSLVETVQELQGELDARVELQQEMVAQVQQTQPTGQQGRLLELELYDFEVWEESTYHDPILGDVPVMRKINGDGGPKLSDYRAVQQGFLEVGYCDPAPLAPEKEETHVKLVKKKWWNPFYKRSYDMTKIINRDHETMENKKIPDATLNIELYKYLRVHRQPMYQSRELCLVHLHKLQLKYYEVEKITTNDMTLEQVNLDQLTVARAVDQKDGDYLYQETRLLKSRGFYNALSTRLGAQHSLV